jgi:hypothetical protein
VAIGKDTVAKFFQKFVHINQSISSYITRTQNKGFLYQGQIRQEIKFHMNETYQKEPNKSDLANEMTKDGIHKPSSSSPSSAAMIESLQKEV